MKSALLVSLRDRLAMYLPLARLAALLFALLLALAPLHSVYASSGQDDATGGLGKIFFTLGGMLIGVVFFFMSIAAGVGVFRSGYSVHIARQFGLGDIAPPTAINIVGGVLVFLLLMIVQMIFQGILSVMAS